jgi:hypothetical protein
MARPLESVSEVRVSLTVNTKQPTDTGAFALCSWWLTKFDYRGGGRMAVAQSARGPG